MKVQNDPIIARLKKDRGADVEAVGEIMEEDGH